MAATYRSQFFRDEAEDVSAATHTAVHSPHAPAALGPYSQAVKANGMLFVSGVLGLNPQTMKFPSDDVSQQTEQVMQNMGAILQAGGASFTSVADCPQVEHGSGRNPAEHQAMQWRQHGCTTPNDCKERNGTQDLQHRSSEAPGNTTKTTTLQGTTGQADKQQSNHAVKHKATPTRQLNYMARKQRTRKARPVEGRQGSEAAMRKTTPQHGHTTQRRQQLAKNDLRGKQNGQQGSGGAQTRQSTRPTQSKAAHHLPTSRVNPTDCWFPPPTEPGRHSDEHPSSPTGNTSQTDRTP
ncbi:hypothetical protein CBR_g3731 [Chara braunii]|uniref:Uncharacterized protein n=1 Tax=Chara braunii TaxID=69332 RepID=A0A388KGD0_CHABU|nr:hypothetical protein CBR_g3731 [Chara braunii]|eukprot:GBG69033.1 hypothetical protein CBR_g3731 [Chara braunii]